MKRKFDAAFRAIAKGLDLSQVPVKHTSTERNYSKFAPVLRRIKRHGGRGLDFGCATGVCSILGRLSGIDVVGVDVEKHLDQPSPYLDFQYKLQQNDYDIRLMDTNIYPWAGFQDNEFDFMIFSNVIVKDYVNNRRVLKDAKGMVSRIKELTRISKPGCQWYVYPNKHVRGIKKYAKIYGTKARVITF